MVRTVTALSGNSTFLKLDDMGSRIQATGTAVLAEGQHMLIPIGTSTRTNATDTSPYPFVVSLHGNDLPAPGEEVVVEGELVEGLLQVLAWYRAESPPSPWATPSLPGTDWATANDIVDQVPDEWPVIGIGVSLTTSGQYAVVVELVRIDGDIRAWVLEHGGPEVVLVIPFTEEFDGSAGGCPGSRES